MDEGNGILASVPGQHIAQASRSLPEPATALQERASVVINADWAGAVRIHYVRQKLRHGKTSFCRPFEQDTSMVAAWRMANQASIATTAAPSRAELTSADLNASGDGLLTVDTATQLQWLDVDQTVGLSLAQGVSSLRRSRQRRREQAVAWVCSPPRGPGCQRLAILQILGRQ